MPDWREGLVEAFPVPEDRRPGWKRRLKAREAALEAQESGRFEDELRQLSLADVSRDPFRFLDLPAEVRNHLYRIVLTERLDYRSKNLRRKRDKLALMRTSRQLHDEMTYQLYTTTTFPLLYLQQFEGPPTVLALAPRYRPLLTRLEMRLGSSWTQWPAEWTVDNRLRTALRRMVKMETLRVFVQFDPTLASFAKHEKMMDGDYTERCGDLLEDVLDCRPNWKFIELDGEPSVQLTGKLVSRLRAVAEDAERHVILGPVSGWKEKSVLQSS